jgi:hypothetical protein
MEITISSNHANVLVQLSHFSKTRYARKILIYCCNLRPTFHVTRVLPRISQSFILVLMFSAFGRLLMEAEC